MQVWSKEGSAPSEIIVQRLASEADSKQTYQPVQPREFVEFPCEDLSLNNLKKACATHFNLPVSTCDILVSNKGPLCSNIAQIPHRKDEVSFGSNFFLLFYNVYVGNGSFLLCST